MLDPATEEIVREQMALGKQLVLPRQVVALSSVVVRQPRTIALEPEFAIESDKVFALLKDCARAAGFAVTIGPGLEAKRDRYLLDRETTRALVLDAVGSVITEELAEITHRQLTQDAAKEGLHATMRFSPGYGDWALKEQGPFLRWLGAEHIGIKLTANFQMLPEKSVSAIVGFRRHP
jgi:hypothetical protein